MLLLFTAVETLLIFTVLSIHRVPNRDSDVAWMCEGQGRQAGALAEPHLLSVTSSPPPADNETCDNQLSWRGTRELSSILYCQYCKASCYHSKFRPWMSVVHKIMHVRCSDESKDRRSFIHCCI